MAEVSGARVLLELARIGFADIRQTFTVDNRLSLPRALEDRIAAAVASIEVVTRTVDVNEVEYRRKIKLVDKGKALEAWPSGSVCSSRRWNTVRPWVRRCRCGSSTSIIPGRPRPVPAVPPAEHVVRKAGMAPSARPSRTARAICRSRARFERENHVGALEDSDVAARLAGHALADLPLLERGHAHGAQTDLARILHEAGVPYRGGTRRKSTTNSPIAPAPTFSAFMRRRWRGGMPSFGD